MSRRPRSGRVVGERDVERWRKPPPAILTHQVADVLRVVVLVPSDDVEDAAPHLLHDLVEPDL